MTNDHAQQILQSISEYKVGAIPKFYKNIKTNIDVENCKRILGYDSITNNSYDTIIDNSIKNTQRILNEIAECYLYHNDSYNAYKHGYRIWTAKEYDSNQELIIYRDKYSPGNLIFPDITSSKEFKDKYIITTDNTSLDVIRNVSNYCLNLFFVIRDNNKEIFSHLSNANHSNLLKLKFINIEFAINEIDCLI